MRNALVPGPGRGNFPREILIETIAFDRGVHLEACVAEQLTPKLRISRPEVQASPIALFS